MANKTVAQPQNAQGEGYTGFANIQEVDGEMPEVGTHSIAYRNARGHLVDPYGRKVSQLGFAQEAGVVGSEEQKASTQYNVVQEEDDTATDDETEENQ